MKAILRVMTDKGDVCMTERQYHRYMKKVAIAERQEAINLLSRSTEVLDVHFESGYNDIQHFLHVARIPTEPVKDIEATITSATKDGTVERPIHMSAEQVEKIHKKSHAEWVDAHKDNPNVDITLVEAMLVPVSESRFIDLNLHIGKIDEYNFGTDRFNIMLDSFNACMPGDNQEEALKALADRFKIEDEVVEKAKKGKLLRVWTSNNASAYCGLCYLANRLEDVDCKIILLDLPTKVRMSDGKLKHSHWLSWGMFPHGEMAFPISQSSVKILSADDITHYANEWMRLRGENTELRIMKDGRAIGSSKDFCYDLIREICPKDKKFRLIKLDNNIVKECRKRKLENFPYYFWASLYYDMIESGEFEVLAETNCSWAFDRWVRYVPKGEKSSKDITVLDKGEFVMDYLESIGMSMIDIGSAIDDSALEKSYRLIQENPTVTKEEFMRVMKIEEYVPRKRKLRYYKNTYTIKDDE